MSIKACKYRIYANKGTTEKLHWVLDRCRELYNAGLQERRDAYEMGVRRHPGYYDEETGKQLTHERAVGYYNKSANWWTTRSFKRDCTKKARKPSAQESRTPRCKVSPQGCHQRKDFQHKASPKLVNRYQVIVFEGLQVKNLTKAPAPKQDEKGKYVPNGAAAKAGLNKSILDAGWSTFTQMVSVKAA